MNASMVKDVTSYAKALGYQGNKPVLVSEGLVVSHRNQEWFSFCDRLREQIPDQNSDKRAAQ